MIAAAYPLCADETEFERGATMRAVQFQQTDRAALIAERDQILTQDPDPQREIAELIGETYRLPEAAHVFAARRIRPDMGEFCILLRHRAVVIAAKSRLQERSPVRHPVPPCERVRHFSKSCLGSTPAQPEPAQTASSKMQHTAKHVPAHAGNRLSRAALKSPLQPVRVEIDDRGAA